MISLIGMGSGCPESLTAQGLSALQGAGLILGAKRLLEHLPVGCTSDRKAVYKPEEILACLAAQPDTDTAVLYSGDTGFYSGAAKLLPLLRTMGYSVRVLPGLSSVQLLAAAVGRPWQDWKLVSAHGRVCDPVAEVLSHPQVFFLTGGGASPATLCSKLTAAGLGAAHALVGENLGTPAEAVRFGLARELAEQSFAPLSVLLIEREALPSRRTPGLPDDAFIRGAVPMTKQEVRAAALAKLAVTPPVVGWVSTLIYSPPRRLNRSSAALVLAICIRLKMPSCMRAPPLAEKMTSGRCLSAAYSTARVIFSPTAVLMLPMKNRLSSTATTACTPPILPVAVTAASFSPVLAAAAVSLSGYCGKCSTSCGVRSAFSSLKVPWSSTRLNR